MWLRVFLMFSTMVLQFKKSTIPILFLFTKKRGVCSTKDFRSISLCNVLYKLIAKVLANRLRVVLDSVISQQQNAFIPNKKIYDNIIVAQEIIHTLCKKRVGRYDSVAIKLDMSKVLDQVEQAFFEAIMKKMKFPFKFIALIMSCFTYIHYSVVVNRNPCGYITFT